MDAIQGRTQDFQIEGAQMIMCTQRTPQAQSPLSHSERRPQMFITKRK